MARILIADDSAVVRLTVGRRLRDAGHEVVACASFAEASGIDPRGLQAVLLDFDLGDGRGIDVAPCFAGTAIAFFTSEDDPALAAEARKLGPVFRKPDDLEAAIAWATTVQALRD